MNTIKSLFLFFTIVSFGHARASDKMGTAMKLAFDAAKAMWPHIKAVAESKECRDFARATGAHVPLSPDEANQIFDSFEPIRQVVGNKAAVAVGLAYIAATEAPHMGSFRLPTQEEIAQKTENEKKHAA